MEEMEEKEMRPETKIALIVGILLVLLGIYLCLIVYRPTDILTLILGGSVAVIVDVRGSFGIAIGMFFGGFIGSAFNAFDVIHHGYIAFIIGALIGFLIGGICGMLLAANLVTLMSYADNAYPK